MNIYEKLLSIQNELKAPKNQWNSFGKYAFRNCEDILEAVKPICSKHKALTYVSDEIVTIGERHYVRATAVLVDCEKEKLESSDIICVTASAREAENKTGMDAAQVTGATSSYARKYALNGLFAIDDTKDPDTEEHKKQQDRGTENKTEQKNTAKTESKQVTTGKTSVKLISDAQRKRLFAISNGNNEVVKRVLERYKYEKTEQIKVSDYEKICTEIEAEITM